MAGKKWTEKELDIIRNNYEELGEEEFKGLLPNRTYKSIECKASKLGLNKPSNAWSSEEVAILQKYYPISSPLDIAKRLPDRSSQSITHMANKLGIYRENYRWTEEEDNILRENYSNKTVSQLIDMFVGRTGNSIKLRARKLGLWQDKSLVWRKYSYNYSFFSEPDITNSYYAGLLAADGSISEQNKTIRISLKDNDAYILERFSEDIEFTGSVKYFVDYPGENSVIANKTKSTDTALLCLSGAGKTIEDLKVNFNIVPNKTLILEPPSSLSFEHSLSYITGYIDGDGSIYIVDNKPKRGEPRYSLGVSLAGTFNVLTWVKHIFDGIESNKNRSNSQVLKQQGSNIWIYKVRSLRAYHILKRLQKVNTPTRLERKWDKIEEYERLVGI